MAKNSLSIITKAEYFALFKNGRNAHRVNSLLSQIYLLCGSGNLAKAEFLLETLHQSVNQSTVYFYPVNSPY